MAKNNIKKITAAILTLTMLMPFQAYADTAYGPGAADTTETNVTAASTERQDPTSLTTEELVRSILAMTYEDDEEAIDLAVSCAEYMTGEMTDFAYHEDYFIAGTHSGTYRYSGYTIFLTGRFANTLIASGPVSGDTYICLPQSSIPDEQQAKENREALELLYDTIWDKKEETAGMGQAEAFAYLYDFVLGSLSAESSEEIISTPASALYYGNGKCGARAALLSILAEACGIECKLVLGTVGGGGHGWLKANIDGTWYDSDPAQRRMLFTEADYDTYEYVVTRMEY